MAINVRSKIGAEEEARGGGEKECAQSRGGSGDSKDWTRMHGKEESEKDARVESSVVLPAALARKRAPVHDNDDEEVHEAGSADAKVSSSLFCFCFVRSFVCAFVVLTFFFFYSFFLFSFHSSSRYTRRHLIRIRMRRKRRAGLGKGAKIKTCQRVMRGYFGRQRFARIRMESHTRDEIQDYGAGLYRNALVHERDRMICRTVFTLQRDRERIDRRRVRERESETYKDDDAGVDGSWKSTDKESFRLAGPLHAVFQHFCDMPQKTNELGSMKFAKFCKIGCHNLIFDHAAAKAAGVKEEKAFRSGKFGAVRGTSIDLAHSKALADMADLEMELANQSNNSQRPSSRERLKKSALDIDGFCRALV